jgi:hypothetical protein
MSSPATSSEAEILLSEPGEISARRELARAETLTTPIVWREVAAVVLVVIAADLTIYRARDFAGVAAFLLSAPLLLTLGAMRPNPTWRWWTINSMLLLLAVRMLWCGSALQVFVGMVLLLALAMVLAGHIPRVMAGIAFAVLTPPAGLWRGLQCAQRILHVRGFSSRFPVLAVVLPALALVVFGSLFVLANPDLMTALSDSWAKTFRIFRDWLIQHGPNPVEIVFWVFIAGVTAGLLRPIFGAQLPLSRNEHPCELEPVAVKSGRANHYSAYRNTLLAVIVLFAVYLVFEFATLWFREFPKGFHYSGYAHEGAAWLTVALAVATLVLSMIFRGDVFADGRLPRLRRLAWLWSAENLLLAVAVYHRLHIYMGFNGLTRMRMVGIFGITAVVLGLLLVIWKIHRGRSFLWLVRSQLTALAVMVFLFAITPIDWIVSTYNVRRIIAGDPAPSVQISVHPIGPEGIGPLVALLECDDPIIRSGIAAMLAQRCQKVEDHAAQNASLGWTTYQISEQKLLKTLREHRDRWSEYDDATRRSEALSNFYEYAYQWY